jgi:hypothetical protein
MISTLPRRRFLQAACTMPILAIGACAAPIGQFSLEEGVRRLLTLSSERAFARLLRPGGFYDDQLTRILPPDTAPGGTNGMLAAILRTNAVRNRMAIALNDVAVDAADRAAPVVIDAVRSLTVADALAIVRGGPTGATQLLERQVGVGVVDALLPGVTAGLDSDVSEILSAVVAARTGVDYRALARYVADAAAQGIFRAIGREEAAIRADPRATRDPAIVALLLAQ